VTTVTVSAEWQRWVEAAKSLSVDSSVQVQCPRNEDAYLKVFDIAVPGHPDMVERYLTCPTCGATNVIRRAKPPAQTGDSDARARAKPRLRKERQRSGPATAPA